MVKAMSPGTMAVISVILVLVTILAGCMSQDTPGASRGEIPASSTGLVQTPVTSGAPVPGNNGTRMSPLITPDESSTGIVNIHPYPSRDWSGGNLPQEDVSRPLYIPMNLPEGFSYNGGSYTSSGNIWLRISNSTTDIIYIQSPESVEPRVFPEGAGVQIQQIPAHNRNYTCTISGTQHRISWNMESLDFSLTGEPGPDELLIIAGTVEPVSDDVFRMILYNVSVKE